MKPVPTAALTAVMTGTLAWVMVLLSSLPLQAREIYALGGADKDVAGSTSSYSWQLGFTQELTDTVAGSVCYLNEGHLQKHRRDGYSPQLWARTDLMGDRLNIGIGVGPYFYFDTQESSGAGGFINKHGWLALASVAATWKMESDLLLVLRSNYVGGDNSPQSLSAMAGIGYAFQPESRDKAIPWERADNEVTVFLGQTIANSLGSQRSMASALEYRRTLLRHIDWTFGLMDEGDNRLIRRDGLVSELWATQELHHNRVALGVGAGAYYSLKRYDNANSNGASPTRLSAIVTLTGSYRFAPHWAFRVSWNRVVTDYDRDTDVLLAGIGYRF